MKRAGVYCPQGLSGLGVLGDIRRATVESLIADILAAVIVASDLDIRRIKPTGVRYINDGDEALSSELTLDSWVARFRRLK